MCRALDLMELIGIRPIRVKDLGHDALIFTRYSLALVDEHADLEAVADEVLMIAAASLGDPIGH